jgi:hypothetical protein
MKASELTTDDLRHNKRNLETVLNTGKSFRGQPIGDYDRTRLEQTLAAINAELELRGVTK